MWKLTTFCAYFIVEVFYQNVCNWVGWIEPIFLLVLPASWTHANPWKWSASRLLTYKEIGCWTSTKYQTTHKWCLVRWQLCPMVATEPTVAPIINSHNQFNSVKIISVSHSLLWTGSQDRVFGSPWTTWLFSKWTSIGTVLSIWLFNMFGSWSTLVL